MCCAGGVAVLAPVGNGIGSKLVWRGREANGGGGRKTGWVVVLREAIGRGWYARGGEGNGWVAWSGPVLCCGDGQG